MSSRAGFVVSIALVCLLGGGGGYCQADPTGTPPSGSMESMVDGLAAAFGASFEDVDDPAAIAAFGEAVRKLVQGSERLLVHGETLGKPSERLRAAIARDAGEALIGFEAGHIEDARRRVHQLVDHCFACHTSLPQAGASGLGEAMARSIDLSQLELKQQVYFLVATRQFETALSRMEAVLNSPQAPRRTTWLFEAHLKLSIRVHASVSRARTALEGFLKKSDATPYLEARVRLWIDSLVQLEARGELADDLPTARRLIDQGRMLNEFPADKRGLVQFVAASGLLLRYLEAHPDSEHDQAEAYYLLGLTESHVSSTLWNDQTGFFLETAIRLRPHSPLAEKAFAFLQEYEIFRHSGASNTYMPDSVQRHLNELSQLARRPSAQR